MAVGLSIRQPWAELILRGEKTIEVRSWPTRHRGELWLHAGAHVDARLLQAFGMTRQDVVFGALVGVCEIYDCVELSAGTWEKWRAQHRVPGALTEKHFAWMLRKAVRREPSPMKGRLGLMRIESAER